jgi:hypothetical protein
MSQGSNFKTQVMEALFNAPTNLINNKAIMWAASNLPDEGGAGEFGTVIRGPYDHDTDSFWNAIGMPGDDMEAIHDKLRDTLFGYVKKNEDTKFRKSMVFEHIEKTLGYEGMMYLAVQGFIKHYEALAESYSEAAKLCSDGDIPEGMPEELKELLRHMLNFKKRKGGDK